MARSWPWCTLFPYTTLFRSAARRDVVDRETPIRSGLGEIPSRHHLHEHHHSRMDVAEDRSEEHTSELQSQFQLVCRPLPEKTKPSRSSCSRTTPRSPHPSPD